ncbi:hypothetical protein A4A49_64212 [Nicotiana attenuata]|uniref:Uncharacterized protein n=1 Tax=Nicotiana attenuata TaxID=49451 RepID=A0A314LCF1_NICAT|nr:hypothetical protein A4A49_64212 [Nicotiana attenuata]
MCASQMSSNKRKMDEDLIDHTTGHPYLRAENNERNLRRRIAYREMPPEEKAALLERCRTEYAARKCCLSGISSAKPSDQSHSSSESQRMIPGQAATFIRDIPSSFRNDILFKLCNGENKILVFFWVSLHGKQVLSWKNDHGEELLYMSMNSKMKHGLPVATPKLKILSNLANMNMNNLTVLDFLASLRMYLYNFVPHIHLYV